LPTTLRNMLENYLLRPWLPLVAVAMTCIVLIAAIVAVFPPGYIERVNGVLSQLPKEHSHNHELSFTDLNATTTTTGTANPTLEKKSALTTTNSIGERWYPPQAKFELVVRQLTGKYVWGIAGVTQLLACLLSIGVSSVYCWAYAWPLRSKVSFDRCMIVYFCVGAILAVGLLYCYRFSVTTSAPFTVESSRPRFGTTSSRVERTSSILTSIDSSTWEPSSRSSWQ
jgi:hypothetical protein